MLSRQIPKAVSVLELEIDNADYLVFFFLFLFFYYIIIIENLKCLLINADRRLMKYY